MKAGEIREKGADLFSDTGGRDKFANELLSGPDEGFASVEQGTFAFIGERSARQPGQSGAGDGASGAIRAEAK